MGCRVATRPSEVSSAHVESDGRCELIWSPASVVCVDLTPRPQLIAPGPMIQPLASSASELAGKGGIKPRNVAVVVPRVDPLDEFGESLSQRCIV